MAYRAAISFQLPRLAASLVLHLYSTCQITFLYRHISFKLSLQLRVLSYFYFISGTLQYRI